MMYNFGSKSSQNYASKLHFITLFDNSGNLDYPIPLRVKENIQDKFLKTSCKDSLFFLFMEDKFHTLCFSQDKNFGSVEL
jgi:hypothetical protein